VVDPFFFTIFVDVVKTPALGARMMPQYLDLSRVYLSVTQTTSSQHVDPMVGSALAALKNTMGIQQVVIIQAAEETLLVVQLLDLLS
jgi:hypothetical protein